MGGIINIGKSIVEGIWSGISSMIGWITDKVTGFFSGIVNGVKGLLGINSPSKVFSDQVGTNMALGVGEGFEKTMGGVRKDIEGAIPTEFNLPSVNAPAVEDVTYGVNPVVSGFDPASVTGQVSQIVMVSPELLRLLSSGAWVSPKLLVPSNPPLRATRAALATSRSRLTSTPATRTSPRMAALPLRRSLPPSRLTCMARFPRRPWTICAIPCEILSASCMTSSVRRSFSRCP